MPHNDRWDRRRKYLLRNFVVNPELSPVPEEERSSPSSDSGSLPDLIVEPAPNRHDDPPAFYEGLEQRMRQYYRKLFLGAKSDDDDSSDFEVNRSMCSSFMLDDCTRSDTEVNVVTEKNSADSDLDHSIAEKRRPTKSTNESHVDKLIDTCATYNETGHVSIDSKISKSSSIEDEENPILIEFCNKQCHANNGDNQGSTNGDKRNRSGALNDTEDVSKIIETKSDSDEAPFHRVSTTVSDIHERRASDSSRVVDNISPVLMPRLLKLSSSVFGRRKISGKSSNISEASDAFIRRLSSDSQLTRTSLDSDKTRDTEKEVQYIDRSLQKYIEESFDYLTPLAQSSEKSYDEVEMMRKARGSGVNKTCHGVMDQDSPAALAFEKQTDAFIRRLSSDSQLTRTSLDSDKTRDTEKEVQYIDRSLQKYIEESFDYLTPLAQSSEKSYDEVEMMRKARGSGVNKTCHGVVDQDSPAALAFEKQTDAFIRRLSSDSQLTRTSLDSDKTRDTEKEVQYIGRSLQKYIEESFDYLTPLAQSSEKSYDEVEMMRKARGSGVNKTCHGVMDQDSPAALAFEKQTDADKLEKESSDSTEINAIEEPNTSPHDTPQNIANINDEFWSVPPMVVDIEEAKEKTRGSKRTTYSEGDATAKRMKKNAAVQTDFYS